MRWDFAVILCRHCPVLDLCEQYADELKERGLKVDGVIAGRRPKIRYTEMYCRGCSHPLIPRSATVLPDGFKREYSSGFCRSCWETKDKPTARAP